MAQRKSKGTCVFCQKEYTKAGISKHLQSCKKRKATFDEVYGEKGKERKATFFHIVIQDAYGAGYFLHIDIPADLKLSVLDLFLRDTWVECCGHLSNFTINGQSFASHPMAEFSDKSMATQLDKVLKPGMQFNYVYDYGSSTELILKVIGERTGKVKGQIIQVMSRNKPFEYTCEECGKPATQICTECMWGSDGGGFLCEDCAEKHECGEEMQLPVVNSPRMGECGYTG